MRALKPEDPFGILLLALATLHFAARYAALFPARWITRPEWDLRSLFSRVRDAESWTWEFSYWALNGLMLIPCFLWITCHLLVVFTTAHPGPLFSFDVIATDHRAMRRFLRYWMLLTLLALGGLPTLLILGLVTFAYWVW